MVSVLLRHFVMYYFASTLHSFGSWKIRGKARELTDIEKGDFDLLHHTQGRRVQKNIGPFYTLHA
ncbi:uncharacterized protein CLUP02_15021 [Colletotrichum lupini]|uniref:Uncharacterized protein n=1 Tax=Colletotrichum lupini TaxID=145971 RepID=A0A9Q8T5Q2_9PEZI|nr:uncharacterized protein CLUP02_15021 [Colletotrichum lupini]KAK1720819.1 hypothetical protein BDP67DRAFT_500977 [Colletotrichum lupini]UQC89490.1 hypothetical protein CLUP02_15021 [Colletotrichum lupini]